MPQESLAVPLLRSTDDVEYPTNHIRIFVYSSNESRFLALGYSKLLNLLVLCSIADVAFSTLLQMTLVNSQLELTPYHFPTTTVDLWIISILRFVIVLSIVAFTKSSHLCSFCINDTTFYADKISKIAFDVSELTKPIDHDDEESAEDNEVNSFRTVLARQTTVALVIGVIQILFVVGKFTSLLVYKGTIERDAYIALSCWTVIAALCVVIAFSRFSSAWLTQLRTEKSALKYEQHQHNIRGSTPIDIGDRVIEIKEPGFFEKNSYSIVKQLIKISAPDAWWLLTAFCCLTIAALAQASIPKYIGIVVDAAGDDPDLFTRSLGELIVSAIISAFFAASRGSIFQYTMARVNRRIRVALFQSLLTQELGFFDTTKSGYLNSRLNVDTQTMTDQVALNLNILLRNLIQITVTLIFMFQMSWMLSLTAFIAVPAVVTMTRVFSIIVMKLIKSRQSRLADANALAQEALSTVSTVRSFGGEAFEIAAFDKALSKFVDVAIRTAKAYFVYVIGSTLFPNLVIALILLYGGELTITGVMSRGQLFAFMLYVNSIFSSMNEMTSVWTGFASAIGAAEKVMELIHRKPRIEQRQAVAGNLTGCGSSIRFSNVYFRYPARPSVDVLLALDLNIRPAEVLALIGPSGGGKSSIIKLIERFYEPTRGSIAVDGVDLRDIDLTWFRQQVAMVSQDPVLYARTIGENISYGLEHCQPSHDDIVQAAIAANAHEFISALPQGYDTQVGEKGVQLSGGQRQRIAIARALIRNPSILLLDEATSALDAESEAIVQAALDDIMRAKTRTIVVIAHRLSTVQNADRLVVIDKGTIAEQGTHPELLQMDGLYARLIQKQLQGFVE